MMEFRPTAIPDVMVIAPRVIGDARGWFMETYQARRFADAGITASFVQDNHSQSAQGVLRGLHYQSRQPQGKLVRVLRGEIFDVAVDLRRSAPTFGRWVGVRMSGENRLQMWIPPGFAHGFYTMSESAEIAYKCTDYYAPEHEHTLVWNDPAISIDWPLIDGRSPLLSAKDSAGRTLKEAWSFP